MVGHQAVTPDIDALFPAPLGHEFQISRVISFVEERLLATISPLGDMVRHPGNYKPS
jgi:hypothetical protein